MGYLNPYGHLIGHCFTNGEAVYVPIPKNGSTSIKQALDWEFTIDYANYPCPLSGFVVIRDPVSRWFSGVAQHAVRFGEDYDRLLDEVEAGRWPVLDEHTQRQTDFILSTFNVEHVKLDNAADYVLDRYGVIVGDENRADWEFRPSVVPMIESFYAADFDLYLAAA